MLSYSIMRRLRRVTFVPAGLMLSIPPTRVTRYSFPNPIFRYFRIFEQPDHLFDVILGLLTCRLPSVSPRNVIACFWKWTSTEFHAGMLSNH